MASSSLSQEDIENDYEMASRRSRIRAARANARNVPLCRLEAHADGEGETYGSPADGTLADPDASPKPTSRAKDKRCLRPNHVNKGKVQRERRKLREKRRSTGVVHLPSTESTGGSTGEDEDEMLLMSAEAKRNTVYNELPTERNHCEVNKTIPVRNNKSPSDLDADDEDNQDYDSAVNQSDSAVSLLHEVGALEIVGRQAANDRPETPCTDNLEELLERAQEENRRLLELLKERDEKISVLEQTLNTLSKDLSAAEVEKQKYLEENRLLLSAMAELRAE